MATKKLTDILKKVNNNQRFTMKMDYYYEHCMNQHRDDKGAFHPSGIGACHMAVAYAFLGYEAAPWSAQTMRKVENGTFMHLRYDDLTKRMNEADVPGFELVNCNVPINIDKPIPIKGHLDAIVLLDGVRELFEYKSIRQEMFNRLTEPAPEYKIQWQIYSRAIAIPVGRIIYENKNTQETKEFEMKYDQEFTEGIIGKLKDIFKYVKKGELPPLPKGINGECTKYDGCQWFDTCWE